MLDESLPGDRDPAQALRIGFIFSPGLQLGIRNYLANLVAAIQTIPASPLVPVLFAGRQSQARDGFPGVERVTTALLDRRSAAWYLRKLIQKLTGRDMLLERLLRRHGVRVLSHTSPLGPGSRIPTIGWIADLQHMRLPELFSPAERSARDAAFHELCDGSAVILVSSACGLEDLRAFSPQNAAKGRVLHFVSAASGGTATPSRGELEERYAFRGPYVLLPNQFWPHKNHGVVVGALGVLRQRGVPVLVLCTGSTQGPDAGYFPAIQRQVEEAGVGGEFRVLGIVPAEDLAGLMHHAVALLNPSRFEGWSTSVEESRSLGKTMLLSDIPVHREQAPSLGVYFSPDDAGELADRIQAAVAGFDPLQDASRMAEAAAAFPARRQEFGKRYLEIVRSLVR